MKSLLPSAKRKLSTTAVPFALVVKRYLLQENSSFLLQETGNKILL